MQLEPCAVNDDCLVLLSRGDGIADPVTLVLAAATLRTEKWRFNYGRKLTPSRIAHFRISESEALKNWVAGRIEKMMDVIHASLVPYLESEELWEIGNTGIKCCS